ncbi:MAG TPA: aldolase/citrate lyase family protein [Caulobacteraceae bacterium]|nr:aldolase/citrate lyase family protein [Caulobacteraceae bacterium]
MRKNLALAKWRRNEPSVGGWLSLANVHTAELMANAGFDWLVVDMQHGLVDYSDLLRMLPAISTTETTPLVRVSGNNLPEINKALDAGAMGVIVPLVNTPEQAAAAVSACLYPPDGTRSFGPTRAALYGGRNYAAEANGEIACIVMIETQQAIDNLEAILTTPHLGGVYVGPSDLALSIGLPPRGDTEEPRHLAAVGQILESCKRHEVPAGIHCSSLAYAQKRLAAGFDFVTLGSDAGFMMQAAAHDLTAVRAG